eukprot:9469021-Pyramimonas_sp.AAC.1
MTHLETRWRGPPGLCAPRGLAGSSGCARALLRAVGRSRRAASCRCCGCEPAKDPTVSIQGSNGTCTAPVLYLTWTVLHWTWTGLCSNDSEGPTRCGYRGWALLVNPPYCTGPGLYWTGLRSNMLA